MSVKYIGLDVHQATTVAAVLDAHGKSVMECILETKSSTLLDFVRGLRGELHVTLEEGSWGFTTVIWNRTLIPRACGDWLHSGARVMVCRCNLGVGDLPFSAGTTSLLRRWCRASFLGQKMMSTESEPDDACSADTTRYLRLRN
jgi:hypothetical protein